MSRTFHSDYCDYMANVHMHAPSSTPKASEPSVPRSVHSWSKAVGFHRDLSAAPSMFAYRCLNISVLQFTKVSIFVTFEKSCWIFQYDLPVRVFLPHFPSFYQHFSSLLGNQRAVHLFNINLFHFVPRRR